MAPQLPELIYSKCIRDTGYPGRTYGTLCNGCRVEEVLHLGPLIFETRQTIEIPRLESGYQITADLCVDGSPDTLGTQLSSTPGLHPSRPESPSGFRPPILLSCYSYDVHHKLCFGDPRASAKIVDISDVSSLFLVARIPLLPQSCSAEDQIEETIVWFSKGVPILHK